MSARHLSSEIATALGGVLHGPDVPVDSIAPLGEPRHGALTFAVDRDGAAVAIRSAVDAGAVVLTTARDDLPGGSWIAVENPRAAFAAAVRDFFAPRVEPGVHPTAVVHPGATVAPSAHVGAFAVIGPGAVIGEGVEIRNHVVVARDVRIGAHSLIKSHAVIGEEGLGIDTDADGNNVRIPHLGSVVLGEHVEVGSFATVCSGTIVPTRIGDHSKIDDHVHIAHNVQMGRNVIATGHVEIAGSVRVGDRAWFGPNSSVVNGVSVGDGAVVGIGAVVLRPIPDGETWFGNPARRAPQAPPAPAAQ